MNSWIFAAPLLVLIALTPAASRPVIADMLYWSDNVFSKIQRSDPNGVNVETIVSSGISLSFYVDVDAAAGKVYWSEFGAGIRRANLDGTNLEEVVSLPLSDLAQGVAVDTQGGKIYWAIPGQHKIQRSNLDGTTVEDFLTMAGRPLALAVDSTGGKLYWSEKPNNDPNTSPHTNMLWRSNLNGTVVEGLHELGQNSANGIALDLVGQRLYWAESLPNDTAKLRRSNLDGTSPDTLISSGLVDTAEIALDVGSGKIYWTQPDVAKIQRSNLDGSAIEDIFASPIGTATPFGLAFFVTDEVCDFNVDTFCNVADINLMYQQGNLVEGVLVLEDNPFDLDADRDIDNSDLDVWLSYAAADSSFPMPFRRGDADLDRDVDITDFSTLITNFDPLGATSIPGFDFGNFDGDNDVDITDFSNHFMLNFILTSGGSYGPNAIPEPSTLLLGGLGLWALALLYHQRHRKT